MLTGQAKADLHKLNDAEKKLAIKQQITRIHSAVNDGTLDREAVNGALEQLTELTQDEKKDFTKAQPDSFDAFTGQKPAEEPHPAAPVAPSAPQA